MAATQRGAIQIQRDSTPFAQPLHNRAHKKLIAVITVSLRCLGVQEVILQVSLSKQSVTSVTMFASVVSWQKAKLPCLVQNLMEIIAVLKGNDAGSCPPWGMNSSWNWSYSHCFFYLQLNLVFEPKGLFLQRWILPLHAFQSDPF